MFPIAKATLSFREISDYWSREIDPPASQRELLRILESAWWLGELRGDSVQSPLELLKKMFASMRHRDDLGIIFIVGDGAGPSPVQLPDGSVKVDVRYQVRVPSGNIDSWDEAACRDAFHALAETSAIESYSELAVGLAFIELSYEEFNTWLTERGYPKPTFWRAQLKKPKRGRPAEYNWDGVKERLAKYVSQHGSIRTSDELMQKCADFACALHPETKTPSDKTIREAIKTHALDAAASFVLGK